MIWLDGQGLKHDWKLVTRSQDDGIDLSQCSLFTSAEEDFNYPGARMTVCGYQAASFPSSFVIAWWAHEQSGHAGRDGGYTRAQQHGLPLTKASLAMATTKGLVCQLGDQHGAAG